MNDVVFILGPTGTGKSEVALELAQRRHAKILCLDSMQVYRGMDIGTGKATLEERRLVEHGGLDLVDPGQIFSVADFLAYAGEFFQKHTRVVVVGGTGLYYRGLTRGLCEAPQASAQLRDELRRLPVDVLQERLRRVDPGIMEGLDLANPRRLARAIEVMETSGRSLREWHQENSPPVVTNFQSFYLHRDRNDLRERIARRVGEMWENGWAAEVEGLVQRYGEEVILKTAAIGYGDVARFLRGTLTSAQLLERIIDATRQYARRQQTWFKREIDLEVIEVDEGMTFAKVLDIMEKAT
jgi:tRNA dimethylallyltransferase